MCIMCAHQKPMVQEVSSASSYEQLVSRSAALGHRPREAGRCREAGKGVKRMKKGSKKKLTVLSALSIEISSSVCTGHHYRFVPTCSGYRTPPR